MPIVFAILLLSAPLYVWRFSVGGLPTNFLMLFSFAVIAVGKFAVFKHNGNSVMRTWRAWIEEFKSLPRWVAVGLILVSLASVISLLVGGFGAEKFAQWIVLYLEPISIFFIVRYFARRDEKVFRKVTIAAYVLLAAAGILAIAQYFTRLTLPMDWWGNANEPKRAIAFFAHPNAYALFATPLLAWLIPDAFRRKQIWITLAWLVGGVGLFLSLSRGSWLGLLAAAGVFVLLSVNKKLWPLFAAALFALVIIVAVVPNLRYRAILPFMGEKSSVARISLWHTGTDMIKDSPILGKGINGFDNNWSTYNKDSGLQHYNFPHNIFLNFWIDLGLLGLIGFIIVFAGGIWNGIKNRQNFKALGLLLFMTALIVHGLIDIPYLKNDLALIFWLILAVSI